MNIASAGQTRIQQDKNKFAVRFQNKTTRPPGAYIASFTGDDGMRFYSDGVKYFDGWKEQGATPYPKQLFPITNNGNLLFEFYENGGENRADFSAFSRVSNSITPAADQILCAGSTVATLTGNNTFTAAPLSSDGNFSVTYQWQQSLDSVAWTNVNSATGLTYTPPATVGSFYYRRVANVSRNNTNVNGAAISVTAPDPSNAVLVTVRPTPTATISVPATVCQNETAVVTFTNPQALPVTITYRIGSGTNQTINVGANTTATVTVTTTTAGVFNYTLLNVQYQTAPNCSANITGTASITVRTLPNGSISAPAICQGQAAKIIFTATAGTGPYSLVINTQTYNSIVSGTAFNANPAPASNTTYNLTKITDANGCIRTVP